MSARRPSLDCRVPNGLWSLWDMMNFMIPHYLAALRVAQQEISVAQANLHGRDDQAIEGMHKDRIRQNMQYVLKKADEYGLETVHDRVERIFAATGMDEIIGWAEVSRQMLALIEAFEDDTKFLYLYAYPKAKGKMFVQVGSDWQAAIQAFPAVKDDISHGVDLYALGHNMACVFHLMRVAEVGVQRFGKKLGVSLTKLTATKLTDLTYDDLAERLKKHGFKETKASIANKLARATLPAHFFLASLAVMGREQVALSEL